jgi:glycosyltransferase involved in cell wall biosynthesis
MPHDPLPIGHVLMTADAVGGVFTYAIELASELARRGVRTTLATMGEPLRARQRVAAAQVPRLRLEESAFKLEWMEDPWRDISAAGDWLLGLEERHRPDVVHLNGYAHAALPWRAPTVLVAHSCVLSWWTAVVGEPAPSKYGRYQEEVARGLREARAVVAPTRAMLQALGEHYGAYGPGAVIPNGVDPRRFAVAPKEPFVFSAGRFWDQAKNLGTLARAARRLTWPVYVAGTATPSDQTPSASASIHGAIRPLGWLDPEELEGWMARAAIYALPARYEPFGLSALEAALCGCALVLGDIPSLREIWGEAATYVPPDDARALTDAIEQIAAQDALRQRLGAAARARGLRFAADRMAARYLRLYRALASRGLRPIHSGDRLRRGAKAGEGGARSLSRAQRCE